MIRKLIAPAALAALVVATTTGCTPRAGQECDPTKDRSYYSTHTENGKTTTVSLECRQVGYKKYEWVKV